MKKVIFTLTIFITGLNIYAQELVADQNPNYKVSMDKYASTYTALQTTNRTTIQDTYTAYDWSTAKNQIQVERRNFRRELRLYNAMNNGWNNNQWNANPCNHNWNNNNNWQNNNWGYHNWNNNGFNTNTLCNPFRWTW